MPPLNNPASWGGPPPDPREPTVPNPLAPAAGGLGAVTHTHTHNHNLLRYVNRRCFTREKRDNYSYQHSATYADNDSTRNRRTDSGGSRYEQGAAEGATAPQILALHPKSGVQQR